MFSVRTNMQAWNADRQFGIRKKETSKLVGKLSSGCRINIAADDAAGLSISEKMRRQIRGLTQASLNAQDGISLVQSAEGAMNELHDMLQRANELAVKAANATLSETDRGMVDGEVQQLKAEIDQTAQHTVFNEIRLFPEDGLLPQGAPKNVWHYDLTYHMADGSVTVNSMDYSSDSVQDAAVFAAIKPTPADSNALANTIATKFIPEAAKQIFDAFPSLKDEFGNATVPLKITVKSLGGAGGMLAQAGYTIDKNTGKGYNLEIQFDSSDFTLADANGTGSMAAALQSTIAHELMHSVMQYTMAYRMKNEFPDWFTEGCAQLSGGGFPTNWNNSLIAYAQKLTDANDSSQDANIKAYLKQYTADNRPYGHGYLAAAYAGWLAAGKGDVTGENIAKGMDRIFADLLKGKKFTSAIKDNTGLDENTLKSHVTNGVPDLLVFVRKLSYESLGGAGSVITPDLNTKAVGMIGSGSVGSGGGGTGNPTPPGPIQPGTSAGGSNELFLQVGADAGQHIGIGLYRMDTQALELTDLNVADVQAATDAIDRIKYALGCVSMVRSTYGAIQNRLEHTIANLDNIIENTTAAEASVRDTDIAKEMVAYSNNQILLKAGQSVLAQANKQQDLILSLLQ